MFSARSLSDLFIELALGALVLIESLAGDLHAQITDRTKRSHR